MRAEMLQVIHKGHQGKERCLLRAKSTVFWPKIMYDIQELIERCIICQEHGKSQSIIGTTQELPPFPRHTLATDIFYWKRMDFLIVTDVFSKYFLVRKLVNSTSAAVCAEIVGVAKKLMDKAGSKGKPWISGLYKYRVTPQSGSIASPLQLITQCTPREKDLSQLPSTLGAQEMYETHQELIRRQQNKPEKNYIELTPGTPVWVQHRQNTSWEPATVVSQCTSNSYWIMQENGTDQPKVYRRTRTMLKIRCTDRRQTRHSNSQLTESEKAEFHTPAIPNVTRNRVEHNSAENISLDLVHLNKLDTEASASFDFKSEEREEIAEIADVPALHLHLHLHWRGLRNRVLTLQDPESQRERTLESQPVHLVIFTCK